MGKEKEEIPEGVVDKEAYKEYIKKSKHPILTKNKIVECSDGTMINLASFPNVITKKIEHLNVKEQNAILTKKTLYTKINNKANGLKRRAFGAKSGAKHGSILSTRKSELIEYFGRMFSIDEMLKHINTVWGIPIKKQALEKFRRDNAKLIDEKIMSFKSSHSDIRLGVKRSRIEELVYLYSKQKDKYEDTLGREDYKLLLTTLEHIRKEAEGDRLTIEGKVDINYEANIQLHLREEIFKTMNLKEIILGRVAARMNVNPVKLIYSLNQSYYAKFSNVLGDYDGTTDDGNITYPSQMNYDFEKIQKYQYKKDKDYEEAVVIDEQENKRDSKKTKTAKEIMLEKLKAKKESRDKARSEINAEVEINDKRKKK